MIGDIVYRKFLLSSRYPNMQFCSFLRSARSRSIHSTRSDMVCMYLKEMVAVGLFEKL